MRRAGAPNTFGRGGRTSPAQLRFPHIFTATSEEDELVGVNQALRFDTLLPRLRDPRRLLAIGLIALTGGLVLAFLWRREELAGADALAYWTAVHLWLSGADPYATPAGVLPYAYPSWSLYVFLPWALLPWDIAWFAWRAVNVGLFAWSVGWAYNRRPLGTAALVALLGPSLAANLDTGNVNVFIALGIWLAWLGRPTLGSISWALSTALKWLPAPFLVFVPRGAWRVGLAVLGVLLILTLATWPHTLRQIDVVVNYPRPVRLDYLLLLWAAVPWLWSRPWPPRLSRDWLRSEPAPLASG